MSTWYRVFGTNDVHPEPAALLQALHGQGLQVTGHFRGDDEGWFRAELVRTEPSAAVEVNCYLASEEGIRQELNGWAAWLEAAGDSEVYARLMRHMIGTARLFTVRPHGEESAAELCDAVCRFLARVTAGVWEADGRGFFAADGTLLVPEGET